jgi:hypothetical protein
VTPTEPDDHFEVLPADEMLRRYYSPDEAPPAITLDPGRVPPALRHLIPLAERWGIGDDLLRRRAVEQAPTEELEELQRVVEEHNDQFDAWLAGSESYSPTPSVEYLAFTHMRMAADGC